MSLPTPKGLLPFIEELRTLKIQTCDNETNIKNVSALIKPWLIKNDWLEEKYFNVVDEVGYKSWLVHEEVDHTLAVYIDAWLPKKGIVPHDHLTWGVIGSVVGIDKSISWKRMDDGSKPGYAEIEIAKINLLEHGSVLTFLPDDIHSVTNMSDKVSISLHVYGKNLNFTGRHQYDPINKTMKPLLLDFS